MELDGKIIGALKNPKCVDLFWVSYEIVPLNKKEETLVNIHST